MKKNDTTTEPLMTSVATTTPRAEPAAPVASPVKQPSAPVRRALRPQMIAIAIIALFVVAIALSHRPSPPLAASAADAQPEPLASVSSSDVAPAPPTAETAPAAAGSAEAPIAAPRASESPRKAPALKPEKKRIAESAGPREAVAAVDEALAAGTPTTTLAAESTPEAAPVSPVSAESLETGAVTITGCLETNGERFRLADTEGGDAPRSRSWRTGFLRKRSTSVALVDPPDPNALQTQVGQRVAATGLLTNRELRVTSMRAVGAPCN